MVLNIPAVSVTSEIGELESVLIHAPGHEVENMAPSSVERSLYSDILNLSVAGREYSQFMGVLETFVNPVRVTDLLLEYLKDEKRKDDLVRTICSYENVQHLHEELLQMPAESLSRSLIEGVEMKHNSLTNYMSPHRYALRPLHNYFFTRDASATIHENVFICKMANRVREREALINKALFSSFTSEPDNLINPYPPAGAESSVHFEGGDILVAREDIILVGLGARTNAQGVDYIMSVLQKKKKKMHVIVQELPDKPESFIHLDMVFTFLDKDKCMVYEPLILKPNRYQTLHITLDNGKVSGILPVKNILSVLKDLGMDLKPILCGGNGEGVMQEREQWHSGTNFFALAPGKVMGYSRNTHTIEEMNKNGFEVLKAEDVISGKVKAAEYNTCVITIEGSELSRGGGGARCMTMPLRRKKVDW